MNPLAHRHSATVDTGPAPSSDAPMQVIPWADDAAHGPGAEDINTRYQGDLFLPGWLKTEVQPSAEQGPGA